MRATSSTTFPIEVLISIAVDFIFAISLALIMCSVSGVNGTCTSLDSYQTPFYPKAVLHQLDQKIIYPHYDFKHLTEKYFEIGMKLDDFLIKLVYFTNWIRKSFSFIL